MRYDIDANNYITNVYFNCNSGTCTEYTGSIPDGYTSIEEWASNSNILAYKIVDGNLVYDSAKDAELQEQWAREETNNISVITDLIYPIGSLYMSVNNVNPSTLFGGTWESWGEGKTIVGVDTSQTEFNEVEKTGGEKTHKLTIDEMPSHNHQYGDYYGISPSSTTGASSVAYNNVTAYPGGSTLSAGGDNSHNNLQPYITCYMWKRTA